MVLASRRVVLASLFAVAVTAPAGAQPYFRAFPPPPPLRREIVPPPPPGPYVWQPGHWQWDGHGYFWAPGHYVRRRPHWRRFHPGHWVRRPRGWVWVEPGWR